MAGDYAEAQKNYIEVEKERLQAQNDLSSATDDLKDAQDRLSEATRNSGGMPTEEYKAATEAFQDQSKRVEELQERYNDLDGQAKSFYDTMSNYENLETAISQGSDTINAALSNIQTSLKTSGDSTLAELQAQSDNLQAVYDGMAQRASDCPRSRVYGFHFMRHPLARCSLGVITSSNIWSYMQIGESHKYMIIFLYVFIWSYIKKCAIILLKWRRFIHG